MNSYLRNALILCSGTWFLIMLGKLIIAPLLPLIESDLGISHARIGIALTGFWAIYAMIQFPSGILSDRVGRRMVMVPGLIIYGLGAALISGSTSFFPFLGSLVIFGIGGGLYVTASMSFLSDTFEKNRGRALSIQSSAGSAAGIIAPMFSIAIAYALSWRWAFLVLAASCILSSLMLYRTTRPAGMRLSVGYKGWKKAFFTRPVLLATAFSSVFAFTWQGVFSFLPVFLVETKSLSTGMSGVLFTLPFLIGTLTLPIAGAASDRFGRIKVLFFLTAIAAISLYLITIVQSLPGIIVALLLMGVGLIDLWPIIMAYIIDYIPMDVRGGTLGMHRMVFILIGSLGPSFLGFMAENGGFNQAFYLLAVMVAASSTALIAGRDSSS